MANDIRLGAATTVERLRAGSAGILEVERIGANVAVMMRRDVAEFRTRFDIEGVVASEAVQKRFVVVDQFPKAGVQVPAGTAINLTFMYKDAINVGKMKDLSDEVGTKYKDENVGRVVKDVDSNPAAKKVVESDKKYEELTAEEKKIVKDYAVEKEILPAEATEEKVEKIYKDLRFIYNF